MVNLKINKFVSDILPDLQINCLSAEVTVFQRSGELDDLITKTISSINQNNSIEDIRNNENIAAAKKSYKLLGKDPNRYRPAAEALMRRIVQGKDLYKINNVVDILNFISIKYGFSICGYDADNIKGGVEIGVGVKSEEYEGIGRGALNIEGLLVFRDNISAFGTPTSDSTRTSITNNTKSVLFAFVNFNSNNQVNKAIEETKQLLQTFAEANRVKYWIIK